MTDPLREFERTAPSDFDECERFYEQFRNESTRLNGHWGSPVDYRRAVVSRLPKGERG